MRWVHRPDHQFTQRSLIPGYDLEERVGLVVIQYPPDNCSVFHQLPVPDVITKIEEAYSLAQYLHPAQKLCQNKQSVPPGICFLRFTSIDKESAKKVLGQDGDKPAAEVVSSLQEWITVPGHHVERLLTPHPPSDQVIKRDPGHSDRKAGKASDRGYSYL
jgi:hypothetical protein